MNSPLRNKKRKDLVVYADGVPIYDFRDKDVRGAVDWLKERVDSPRLISSKVQLDTLKLERNIIKNLIDEAFYDVTRKDGAE